MSCSKVATKWPAYQHLWNLKMKNVAKSLRQKKCENGRQATLISCPCSRLLPAKKPLQHTPTHHVVFHLCKKEWLSQGQQFCSIACTSPSVFEFYLNNVVCNWNVRISTSLSLEVCGTQTLDAETLDVPLFCYYLLCWGCLRPPANKSAQGVGSEQAENM